MKQTLKLSILIGLLAVWGAAMAVLATEDLTKPVITQSLAAGCQVGRRFGLGDLLRLIRQRLGARRGVDDPLIA